MRDASRSLRLFAFMMHQDDPKKCTCGRLSHFGLVTPISRVSKIPKNAVLLNPYSEETLFPGDKELVVQGGLGVIDCSWKRAKEVFSKRFRGTSRRLPILLAANPVNYGHASDLSSAEALIAALYIVGLVEDAERLAKIFKWGPVFIALNKEPLQDYSSAKSRDDINRIENEYF